MSLALRTDLEKLWLDFHEEHPGVPLREAAEFLGVTEAELLWASRADNACLIEGPIQDILAALLKRGSYQFEVRNNFARIKHESPLLAVRSGSTGVSGVGDSIHFHLELAQFAYAFRLSRALRFFNRSGLGILDIGFADEALTGLELTPPSNDTLNIELLPSAVSQLAPSPQAQHVTPHAIYALFEAAVNMRLGVALGLENAGCAFESQLILERAELKGQWFRAFGGRCEFHLRQTRIGAAWIIPAAVLNRPSSTYELFDKTGEPLFSVYCASSEAPQNQTWEEHLRQIPRLK